MADDDCKDVKLNYINNVQAALFVTGRRIHGLVLLYFTAIILTFLLSLNIISIAPQIAFAGIVLSVPRTLLLVGGSVLVGLFQFYIRAVSFYRTRLQGEISKAYRSLGLTQEAKSIESSLSTVDFPDLYTLSMDALGRYTGRYIGSHIMRMSSRTGKVKTSPGRTLLVLIVMFFIALWVFATMVGIVFLPTVAQVLAIKEVVVTQHGLNWPIAIVIIVLVTIDSLGWISLTRTAVGVLQSLTGAAVHTAQFVRASWREQRSLAPQRISQDL